MRSPRCLCGPREAADPENTEHRESIVRSLRENLILLERAKAEDGDGQRGAGNHARHLAREVAALTATMSIHDDPSIADGGYVQLDLLAPMTEPEAAK